ncbi:hypothetical protein tb265_41180 [Gemmatimonadetes bacterium T265]|nr:hypothetical protein tb265_41180 [Gemmatimonadetes bacterium T265]
MVQEGLRAGTWVAGGVACALALVDVRAGEPLTTPALVGYGVAHVLGLPALADSLAGVVVGSTALHLASCVAVATVGAAIARRVRGAAARWAASLLVPLVAGLAFAAVGTVFARTSPLVADAVVRLVLGDLLGWVLLSGAILYAHRHVPGAAPRPTSGGARYPAPPSMPYATHAAARSLAAVVGAAALTLVAGAAGAQLPNVMAAPDSAPANADVAGGAPSTYVLDDALLAGIPLTTAQVQHVLELRALWWSQIATTRPEVDAAVRAMARAHARHDEATRRIIFAMLQTNMAEARTWGIAAVRTLLTAEQRPLFDANVQAVLGDGTTREPSTDRPSSSQPSAEPHTAPRAPAARRAARRDRIGRAQIASRSTIAPVAAL